MARRFSRGRRALVPALVRALGEDAAAVGVGRLSVQVRPHDWVGRSIWHRLGLRPDRMLAGAALPADAGAAPAAAVHREPGVRIRRAMDADEDRLVALAMAQHRYHARHTRTGTLEQQAEAPTRRQIVSSLRAQEAGTELVLVAEAPGGTALGHLLAMTLTVPQDAPGRAYLPMCHGYIAQLMVDDGSRGTGVGTALVRRGLDWLRDRGHTEALVHYVVDNPTSAPFWEARGLAPIVLTLSGDVLGSG